MPPTKVGHVGGSGKQDEGMVSANLERIPGGGDLQAVKALDRSPEVVDGLFLCTLDKQNRLALGRYGVRAVTMALRSQDPQLLRRALLASAISTAAEDDDRRDTMVRLALHYFCAQQLGTEPSIVFNEVADRIADPAVAGLLRVFGTRTDVTLDRFGWTLIESTDGLDFQPC